MPTKFLTNCSIVVLLAAIGLASAPGSGQSSARPRPSDFETKKFSVNFENTDLRAALDLIAKRAGLRLDAPEDLKSTISYSFANVTLAAALDQIAREKGLDYRVTNKGMLQVHLNPDGSGGRSPAQLDGSTASGARLIKLKYLTTSEAMEKISTLLMKDDKLIEDRPSNSLAYFGSARIFDNIKEAIALFDVMPQQIYIEAHIVELNSNKSLEFGFSYGDLGDPTLATVGKSSAAISNRGPATPNFAIQLGLGKIDGDTLSARLAAAEVDGSAKILSRPKVVTINNRPANISSGISYSVRTLVLAGQAPPTGTGSGTDGGVAAGISQVKAGLTLVVTPTVVDGDKIKLLIDVSNSEPDESTLVDGIPGVVSNSTNTEIIVENGKTASVAGLIKNSFANSETGVPFLSKIPILGWLFKSRLKSNRDKELMVFITPRIVTRELAQLKGVEGLEKVGKAFPEVDLIKALEEKPETETPAETSP